jgi:hypothetical protein
MSDDLDIAYIDLGYAGNTQSYDHEDFFNNLSIQDYKIVRTHI